MQPTPEVELTNLSFAVMTQNLTCLFDDDQD